MYKSLSYRKIVGESSKGIEREKNEWIEKEKFSFFLTLHWTILSFRAESIGKPEGEIRLIYLHFTVEYQ